MKNYSNTQNRCWEQHSGHSACCCARNFWREFAIINVSFISENFYNVAAQYKTRPAKQFANYYASIKQQDSSKSLCFRFYTF